MLIPILGLVEKRKSQSPGNLEIFVKVTGKSDPLTHWQSYVVLVSLVGGVWGFFHTHNGLNKSKDTFEPDSVVFLPCCNLHSHMVDKPVSIYNWQNRKTEHFSPECQGLISTAAQLHHRSLWHWSWLGLRCETR